MCWKGARERSVGARSGNSSAVVLRSHTVGVASSASAAAACPGSASQEEVDTA